MSEYYITELQHHGIPGMRWGIRRYQNKDGSLTAAGRRREAKLDKQMGKYAKKYHEIKRKKLTGDNEPENKPKTIKDLSNEELKARTTRLNLEKDYLNAIKNRKDAEPPKRVSKGKEFAINFMKEKVAPSALSIGEDYIKDKLGLNSKSKESARLKREAQDYENRVKIEKNKQKLATGKY